VKATQANSLFIFVTIVFDERSTNTTVVTSNWVHLAEGVTSFSGYRTQLLSLLTTVVLVKRARTAKAAILVSW